MPTPVIVWLFDEFKRLGSSISAPERIQSAGAYFFNIGFFIYISRSRLF